MPFNDFINKYKLKSKATSNLKITQVLSSIGLDNVDIYLRDWPLSNAMGIVNLHPSKRTQWVAYFNEIYFDSYGSPPPRKLSRFLWSEMDIVFFLNTRYKIWQVKEILFVQVIVYIQFTEQKPEE